LAAGVIAASRAPDCVVVVCRRERSTLTLAAGLVLLGIRVHAEAAEGDAPPCGYELTLRLEALLSVSVDAALITSLTRSRT
jgi:hypothetical protein